MAIIQFMSEIVRNLNLQKYAVALRRESDRTMAELDAWKMQQIGSRDLIGHRMAVRKKILTGGCGDTSETTVKAAYRSTIGDRLRAKGVNLEAVVGE